jgi:steroid 5-alpha reductase family enzyme
MTFMPALVVLAASSLAMLAGFAVERRTRNAGIVDVIWASGLAASAVYYGFVGGGSTLARVLVALLGGLWGARLALHLALRVVREPEDGRYAYLRAHWDGDARKFLAFFLAQAALTALFSLPFLAAASNPGAEWTPWRTLALVVYVASVGGEALADRQLAAFRADPANRGRTCRAGLWRMSRHPNYFFEWTHWFAYVLLAVGAGGAFWLTLLGPVLMLVLLYRVTGIPFTEAQALRSRGDDYRDYQRTTSPFVPWFPRRTQSQRSSA